MSFQNAVWKRHDRRNISTPQDELNSFMNTCMVKRGVRLLVLKPNGFLNV